MAIWDIDGDPNVGYKVLYYCTRDEDFFELSPIAPLRCPMCFCDARYIIGPVPANVIDVNDYINKQKRRSKYRTYYNE